MMHCRRSRGRFALGASLILAVCAGCGGSGGPDRVEVYDGQSHPESPYGLQLFPSYTTTLVLPERAAEQNLDVPATHGG